MGVMQANEASVVANLADLFEIESQRREEEAAEEARREMAEAQALREQNEGQRWAQELERVSAQQALGDKQSAQAMAETSRDIDALRQQLSEVQADRARLHARFAEAGSREIRPGGRQGSRWIVALSVLSLVCATLATGFAWTAGTQDASAPVAELTSMQELSPSEVPEAVALAAETLSPNAEEATTPQAVADEVSTDERVASPQDNIRHRPGHGSRHRPGHRGTQNTRETNIAAQLDLGEGDQVLSDDFLRQNNGQR